MSNIEKAMNVRQISEYIKSHQFKLHYYELDVIKNAISKYIAVYSKSEYMADLENKSQVYRLFHLYKRIFDIRLNHRDQYTITFNPVELEMVMGALNNEPNDMITRALYGKIHQKTI